MFRASTLLNNARLERELDLGDVAKRLKINVKYLEALEQENIHCFPQEPYCSLFIKDYADFLGLNGQEILRIFRRDFAQKHKQKLSKKTFFSFTPQFTFTVSIMVTISLFSLYLISEYIKFNRPPKLKVDWPPESVLVDNNIDVNGTTDPESTVRVNQDLVIVDQYGNFQKKISLVTAETKVVIESKGANGKSTFSEKTFKINK